MSFQQRKPNLFYAALFVYGRPLKRKLSRSRHSDQVHQPTSAKEGKHLHNTKYLSASDLTHVPLSLSYASPALRLWSFLPTPPGAPPPLPSTSRPNFPTIQSPAVLGSCVLRVYPDWRVQFQECSRGAINVL